MIARHGPAPPLLVTTMTLTYIASLAFMQRHPSVELAGAAARAGARPMRRLHRLAGLHRWRPSRRTRTPGRPRTRPIPGPVLLVVRNNRRLEEIEATAKNNSNQPLSVMLAAEDGWGEVLSIERLDLDAGEARRFGAIHGLPLPNGGRIRIHTPGYVDHEVDIPL